MKILAIDPGVTTGYCYAEIEVRVHRPENSALRYYPFQWVDDVDECWDRIEAFKPRYIIIEDFEFRQRTRTGLNLFPVQLIGVARLYELKCKDQCAVYLQKASYGKSYYTDQQLKQLNLYKKGVPHGMDASRHLLQWFTFGAGFQYNNGTQDFAKILDSWEG